MRGALDAYSFIEFKWVGAPALQYEEKEARQKVAGYPSARAGTFERRSSPIAKVCTAT